jgi:hypothetical protein
MDTLKVCFYDPVRDALVGIKDFPGSLDSVNHAGLLHTCAYPFEKHKNPYPVWLAFNPGHVLRIFPLDSGVSVDQDMLHRIDALVRDTLNHPTT